MIELASVIEKKRHGKDAKNRKIDQAIDTSMPFSSNQIPCLTDPISIKLLFRIFRS